LSLKNPAPAAMLRRLNVDYVDCAPCFASQEAFGMSNSA